MKLWNVNFLQHWPIVSITAKKTMQENKQIHNQTTMLKANDKSAYALRPKRLQGDEIMTVNGLIKEFIKQLGRP